MSGIWEQMPGLMQRKVKSGNPTQEIVEDETNDTVLY